MASTSQTAENEPEPSEHVVRWEHNVIRTAFLEDSAKKMFVRRIKELDPLKVLGFQRIIKNSFLNMST